jgi:hypothetical protein
MLSLHDAWEMTWKVFICRGHIKKDAEMKTQAIDIEIQGEEQGLTLLRAQRTARRTWTNLARRRREQRFDQHPVSLKFSRERSRGTGTHSVLNPGFRFALGKVCVLNSAVLGKVGAVAIAVEFSVGKQRSDERLLARGIRAVAVEVVARELRQRKPLIRMHSGHPLQSVAMGHRFLPVMIRAFHDERRSGLSPLRRRLRGLDAMRCLLRESRKRRTVSAIAVSMFWPSRVRGKRSNQARLAAGMSYAFATSTQVHVGFEKRPGSLSLPVPEGGKVRPEDRRWKKSTLLVPLTPQAPRTCERAAAFQDPACNALVSLNLYPFVQEPMYLVANFSQFDRARQQI